MHKKITTLLITFVLSASIFITTASASTLHTFKSDYDADKYTKKQINFQIATSIPKNWYPLKDTSQYLPIEVSWDNSTREVVIHSSYAIQANNYFKNNIIEKRYKSNRLPSSLKIKSGITYCSPQFLTGLLGDVGFMYNGETYCFDGEDVSSKLIDSGKSKNFKDNVITSMYQLKLKMPDEYKFIKEHLTGGIVCIEKGSDKNIPNNALAGTYVERYNPCCYIVGDKLTGINLASVIAHESYHVYQYKNGMEVDEDGADEYEKMIKQTMIAMN